MTSSGRDEREVLRKRALPGLSAGVDPRKWLEEKVRFQNPRIRLFLGLIDTLEGARESNFVLLHCAPRRIAEIHDTVRQVARIVRIDVAPLLAFPSPVPRLETVRESVRLYLATLEESVFAELDRFPERVPEHELAPLRRFLCVALGKLHAFLVDSQSRLLAADPRSIHSAGFFLARKFPRDVEEAEFLHGEVLRLAAFVEEVEKGRKSTLAASVLRLRREKRLPGEEEWGKTDELLGVLRTGLGPRLREVLTLEGIRVQEIDLIEGFLEATLPDAVLAGEISRLGQRLRREIERSSGSPAASRAADRLLAARLAEILERIDARLLDLVSFLPLWERGIGQRRALLVERQVAAVARGEEEPVEEEIDDADEDELGLV